MSSPELPLPVVSRNQSQSSRRSSGSVRQTTATPAPPVETTAPENPGAASSQEAITPLPQNSTTIDQDEDDPPGKGPYYRYVEYVAEDSPILHPQFIQCYKPKKLDVIILDIKKDGTCLTEPFGESQSMSKYLKSISESPDPIPTGDLATLKKFLEKSKPPDVIMRLVLVEDLSPATVEVLGSALDLSPSFFSEHLVGAQYRDHWSRLSDPGKVPSRVKLKNHISWSWKRKIMPISDNENVAGNLCRPYMWPNSQNDTEIYRSYRSNDEHKTRIDPGITGERISFLAKNDDCLTGIYLFDPPVGGPSHHSIHSGDDRSNMNTTLSFKNFTDSGSLPPRKNLIDPSTRNWFATHVANMMSGSGSESCACGNSMDASDVQSLIHPILHCILYDWWHTLEVIERLLDEPRPQEKIEMVGIFGNLRKILFEGSETAKAAMKTIGGKEPGEKTLSGLKAEFEGLLDRLEGIKDRTEKATNALALKMSIRESKRAISEAESISRLTELAFFFIPLSFATSVFGMQIQGWSENYRPYMWPLVSGFLVLGAYAFRYTIHLVRSSWFKIRAGENPNLPFLIRMPGVEERISRIRKVPLETPVPKSWILAWFIEWYLFEITWVLLSVVVLAVVLEMDFSIRAKTLVAVAAAGVAVVAGVAGVAVVAVVAVVAAAAVPVGLSSKACHRQKGKLVEWRRPSTVVFRG